MARRGLKPTRPLTYVDYDKVEPLLSTVTTNPNTTIKRLGFQSLLTTHNLKVEKSNAKEGYYTAILHLSPGISVCHWASPACLRSCLNRAGIAYILQTKLKARKKRTALLFDNTPLFLAQLVVEIRKHVRKAESVGRIPAIRLNGTSDIPWERITPWLFDMFPTVQFYDYTKGLCRLGRTPPNYHLTFSRSETNAFEVGVALERGFQVAVVVEKKAWCDRWHGFRTCSGEADDLIFQREALVQLLVPKGPARKDRSGFVVREVGP